VAEAKAVFVNGLGLDVWIDGVADRSGGDAPVTDLGAAVPVKRAGEEGDRSDPHWFHDARNVEVAVDLIRDRLAKADPAHARGYVRNAAAYLRKVRALDKGIAGCMGAVPPAKRKLVTDHDAFGYFTARYGIQVVGAVIPSQTTQAQPSASDIAQLADTIKRERVKAIFPEQSLNQKLADALADQTGVTSQYELYGDALGPPGSSGATYVGMEQANADAMVRGFTGGRRGCRIGGIA
jgi:zinc/manganese transport system substrate-binding protein